MLAGLIGRSAPVFGSSDIEWPPILKPEAYFEVDIGYKVIEEVVTLTNGKRMKGWVVNPPQITAKRGAKYDRMRELSALGCFWFWEPGKVEISAIDNNGVKEIEVISNES